MKKLIFLFPVALILSFGIVMAQETSSHRRCGTTEYMNQLFQQDPAYKASLDAKNQELESLNHLSAKKGNKTSSFLYIPVVVHCVYRTAAESISVQRVAEQLQTLNEDYSLTNADAANIPSYWQSIAANTEIQFCLAITDPNGNPTTGITYTQTTVTSFSTDNKVKFASQGGHDVWNRSYYLNIWVCNLGSGLLGYAQFPGGPANTDGVVIGYPYFGNTSSAPYNKGRTSTHEIGHWLNLNHIWGDDGSSCAGTDYVTDTPNQADETYGCFAASTVRISCTNGPNGDMWMNYMDYTDDACMYMFTAGQKTRMVNTLNSTRLALQSSTGCGSVGHAESVLNGRTIKVYPNPANDQLAIEFTADQKADFTINLVNSLGQVISGETLNSFEGVYHNSLNTSDLPQGTYLLVIQNGTSVYSRSISVIH
jgi:hypothetical protein